LDTLVIDYAYINIKTIKHKTRVLDYYDIDIFSNYILIRFIIGEKQATTVWPDPNLGCLGAKDRRFNLPGNIGLDNAVIPAAKEKPATPEQIQADKKAVEDEVAFWKNLCDSPTNYQRQVGVSTSTIVY